MSSPEGSQPPPGPAIAPLDSWLSCFGIPRKFLDRNQSGTPEGQDQKGSLIVRDRVHPFTDDEIVREAGVLDPILPVLAEAVLLAKGLPIGGSYELVEVLWSQFVLTAGGLNIEVGRTRDEVAGSSMKFQEFFLIFSKAFLVSLLLVDHFKWNAARNFVSVDWVG